ncbi:MAG TPA: hypothetical protein VNB06_18405 [Thermoanaerobaculia bacterium]|nr:hypothetical protein [Thermoanaerobaculia bacterium]
MSDEARHLPSAVPADHGHGHGHGHADHGDPDPEIRVTAVAKILLAIAVVTVVFAVLVWPLAWGFFRSEPPPDRAIERIDRSRPAGPLLQVNPTAEIAELRRQEQRVLDSYDWVDRSAGIARVPVERALELVLADGVGAIAAAQREARREHMEDAVDTAVTAPPRASATEDDPGSRRR